MDTYYWIYTILSLLAIFSVFVGLWIAMKFLPSIIKSINIRINDDIFSRPFLRIILWLVLGGLFTLPLLDLIKWLVYWASILFMPAGQSGLFSTFLGSIPPQVFYGFMILMMFVLYAVVIWLANDYLSIPGQFNRTERFFIVLSIASLFYRGVTNIVTYLWAFQLPPNISLPNLGISGFLSEVLGGLIILILILYGFSRLLPSHPNNEMQSRQ